MSETNRHENQEPILSQPTQRSTDVISLEEVKKAREGSPLIDEADKQATIEARRIANEHGIELPANPTAEEVEEAMEEASEIEAGNFGEKIDAQYMATRQLEEDLDEVVELADELLEDIDKAISTGNWTIGGKILSVFNMPIGELMNLWQGGKLNKLLKRISDNNSKLTELIDHPPSEVPSKINIKSDTWWNLGSLTASVSGTVIAGTAATTAAATGGAALVLAGIGAGVVTLVKKITGSRRIINTKADLEQFRDQLLDTRENAQEKLSKIRPQTKTYRSKVRKNALVQALAA